MHKRVETFTSMASALWLIGSPPGAGEVCTPVAPAVQHMAADGSGATWRHIKRKSATDPAASTEQPNAAAALPAVLPGEEVPPAAETQQVAQAQAPVAIAPDWLLAAPSTLIALWHQR